MRMPRLLATACLALAACYTEDSVGPQSTGPLTTVEITDAPFPFDSVARVDLYVVSIAVRTEADTSATATGWVTVAEPRRRFNLIALNNGVTDTLGGSIVPAGQYKAVRMIIDTDSTVVTASTGRPMPVDWQSSAGRPALYALVEDPIGVSDSGSRVVVDFDVGRSFLVSHGAGCGGTCDGFVFSPVFRAVNRSTTGAVSGTVAGDTLAAYAAPIANVTVTVYSGDPDLSDGTWSVRATGRTDAAGRFRIAYLLPGTYILRADAPRASPFTPGVRTGVVVTAGEEVVNQSITLPRTTSASIVVTPLPPYAYVHDSLYLTATLLDSAGQAVPGATIGWSDLDTAVALLYVSPFGPANRALVLMRTLGTARFVVTADALSRTLTIPVLAAPPTGVAWVQISPDSLQMAVRDSVIFIATAHDSAGIAMPNQTYTWTSTDTTVATVSGTAPGNFWGYVRALKAGTTQIRATSGGKTGGSIVTVR